MDRGEWAALSSSGGLILPRSRWWGEVGAPQAGLAQPRPGPRLISRDVPVRTASAAHRTCPFEQEADPRQVLAADDPQQPRAFADRQTPHFGLEHQLRRL